MFCATTLLFVLIAAAVVIGLINHRRVTWVSIARMIVAVLVAGVLTLLIKHLVNDPRPFMVEHYEPLLIGFVAVLVVGCALLGLLLSRVTGIDPLTGYLATTPGGINAVTITALSVGVNTTLVVAVQTVRLLVTLLLGPPLVQWWVNWRTNTTLTQSGSSE